MNNGLFQQAKTAFRSRDYETALNEFTQCLQDTHVDLEPGEMGLLYHQIGNCLMKLHDFEEAIHAYTQSTADTAYDAAGAVNCNLGTSYAALHDYEDAVQHYEIAVSDSKYGTPYKAYQGMGKALLKLGKSAEAGSAFRSAALDETNPNPAQSLLNLGICFMALNRPADAVASYESALQFHMTSETKNKLYANLGQSYTANNQMQQAVDAFEKSLSDKTYYLNDAASVDYQNAVAAIAQGTAVMDPVSPVAPSAPATDAADMSGLDVPADGAPVYHETDYQTAAQDPQNYAESYGVQDQYESGDDRFFNASDEELEQWSRGVAKQDRKRRNVGLKIIIFLIVVIIAAAIAGMFAYSQGYGYPTQEAVAKQLFSDKTTASTTLFASDLDSSQIDTMLSPVVEDSNVQIDGVDRSMNSSSVYVTASTPEGGSVQYKVTMARSGIGWKVANIDLYFASQN